MNIITEKDEFREHIYITSRATGFEDFNEWQWTAECNFGRLHCQLDGVALSAAEAEIKSREACDKMRKALSAAARCVHEEEKKNELRLVDNEH